MDNHHTKHDEMETIENASNVLRPTPSNFERLYLAPEQPVAGVLRYTFGNPTPVALAGFLLANTPATCMLMGWHGAGGGAGIANADTGAYFFLGGVLLYAGAIGEWILGNTFPAVVFFVSRLWVYCGYSSLGRASTDLLTFTQTFGGESRSRAHEAAPIPRHTNTPNLQVSGQPSAQP